MKIIRTEVQVTPKIDLIGSKKYYWRVFQIVDGVEITLTSGFEDSILKASSMAFNSAKKYI